jgi:hypothetical protein
MLQPVQHLWRRRVLGGIIAEEWMTGPPPFASRRSCWPGRLTWCGSEKGYWRIASSWVPARPLPTAYSREQGRLGITAPFSAVSGMPSEPPGADPACRVVLVGRGEPRPYPIFGPSSDTARQPTNGQVAVTWPLFVATMRPVPPKHGMGPTNVSLSV